MEEMQGNYGPYDKEAEAVEMGKLDLDFEEWAKELENIFVQNGQNINDHSMSSEDWDAKIWTMETPEQYYNRVMGVQEKKENNPWAICTASVGRKDKDKYEKCVLSVKQQKENKTMKISKAELMEIIKEEIMGAMSEEEAVEEVTEEQPLQEMDFGSMLPELTPQKFDELITVLEVFKKLVTNGVIPMGALGAGAGALYNKVAGPQVPPEDMGDK